jgi:hypothetical protein
MIMRSTLIFASVLTFAGCGVGGGTQLTSESLAPEPQSVEIPPTVEDHWHIAYGFNVCDSWLPDLQGSKEELDAQGQLVSDKYRRSGVHSHDDGVIHWHPFSSLASGENAELDVFLDVYGIGLDDEVLRFPQDQGGAIYDEGVTKCAETDGQSYEAVLSVFVFDRYDDSTAYTQHSLYLDRTRITANEIAITISFNKPSWIPQLPPSAELIPNLLMETD